jgi:hypothetical protein
MCTDYGSYGYGWDTEGITKRCPQSWLTNIPNAGGSICTQIRITLIRSRVRIRIRVTSLIRILIKVERGKSPLV